MSIDPKEIELTPEQRKMLAEKAERSGVGYSVLLDEWLGLSVPDADGVNLPTVLERMKAIGAVGCFEGPGDLSTLMPKLQAHMDFNTKDECLLS